MSAIAPASIIPNAVPPVLLPTWLIAQLSAVASGASADIYSGKPDWQIEVFSFDKGPTS